MPHHGPLSGDRACPTMAGEQEWLFLASNRIPHPPKLLLAGAAAISKMFLVVYGSKAQRWF